MTAIETEHSRSAIETEHSRRGQQGSRERFCLPDDVMVEHRSSDEQQAKTFTGSRAWDVCLRLLTVRARSRAELDRRLAEKGFDEEVRVQALERLTEVGLIDDRQFAEDFARSKHEGSGKTGQALAVALRQKGLGDADIAAALDQISPEQQEERAREFVRKKLGRAAPDPRDQRLAARLVGMLARRGYDSGLALRVVRAELAGGDFDH